MASLLTPCGNFGEDWTLRGHGPGLWALGQDWAKNLETEHNLSKRCVCDKISVIRRLMDDLYQFAHDK